MKTLLQLTCQLTWVVGLVVGLSGVYLLLKYKHCSLFFSGTHITLPAVVALASAVFLVAGGCLGSWLSLRDSSCLQGLFVYLLVVIFCLESTALALAYFHTTKLDSELAALGGVFEKYTGSSQDPNSRAVDATQEELQCCGVHDYTDWQRTSWFNRTGGHLVPQSCCNSTFPSCNGTLPWELYTQGCQVKLQTVMQFVLSFIIWGSPLVFAVEVVLFLTMGQLMRDESLTDYQVLHKH